MNLRVERDERHAKVVVRDTGQGIPERHLTHIFERFYQVNDARSSGGCGLGLSICRWIAEAHYGSIEVSSSEGLGTTFAVILPVATANPPVRQSAIAAKRLRSRPVGQALKQRVGGDPGKTS